MLPPHASAACESQQSGTTCTATCAAGYYAFGNPTYTCLEGTWAGDCGFACEIGRIYDDKLLMFSRDLGYSMLSQPAALAACDAFNATLAVPTSKAENDFLYLLGKSDGSKPKWLGVRRDRSQAGTVFTDLAGQPLDILSDAACSNALHCPWAVSSFLVITTCI
jgi:hypothetical protein